jgi:hypothetical protein
MTPDSSSYCPDSDFFQSDGFHNCDEHNHIVKQRSTFEQRVSTFEQRRKDVLNYNLTNIQMEIYESIKYNNWEKLLDLGGESIADLDFLITVQEQVELQKESSFSTWNRLKKKSSK